MEAVKLLQYPVETATKLGLTVTHVAGMWLGRIFLVIHFCKIALRVADLVYQIFKSLYHSFFYTPPRNTSLRSRCWAVINGFRRIVIQPIYENRENLIELGLGIGFCALSRLAYEVAFKIFPGQTLSFSISPLSVFWDRDQFGFMLQRV